MCPWKTLQNATWLFKAITKQFTEPCYILGFWKKTQTSGKLKLMFLNENHTLLQNAGIGCYKLPTKHRITHFLADTGTEILFKQCLHCITIPWCCKMLFLGRHELINISLPYKMPRATTRFYYVETPRDYYKMHSWKCLYTYSKKSFSYRMLFPIAYSSIKQSVVQALMIAITGATILSGNFFHYISLCHH